jgi:hypothetical protein
MKIRSVGWNDRRKHFEVRTVGKLFSYPYAKADPSPTAVNRVVRTFVDKELGREAFGYVLQSGAEGIIHVDNVLYHNSDPDYLRNQLLYNLTMEAQEQLKTSSMPRREILRRLGTSASQLRRIIDQTNYRKSIDQVLRLLHVLKCEVGVVIRPKRRPGKTAA